MNLEETKSLVSRLLQASQVFTTDKNCIVLDLSRQGGVAPDVLANKLLTDAQSDLYRSSFGHFAETVILSQLSRFTSFVDWTTGFVVQDDIASLRVIIRLPVNIIQTLHDRDAQRLGNWFNDKSAATHCLPVSWTPMLNHFSNHVLFYLNKNKLLSDNLHDFSNVQVRVFFSIIVVGLHVHTLVCLLCFSNSHLRSIFGNNSSCREHVAIEILWPKPLKALTLQISR